MNLNNIYCIRAERKLLCTLYEVKWNDFQVQNIKILASWLSSLLPLPLVLQRVIGFFFFSFVNFAKIGSRLSKCTSWVESSRTEIYYIISYRASPLHGHQVHSCWYWTCVLYACAADADAAAAHEPLATAWGLRFCMASDCAVVFFSVHFLPLLFIRFFLMCAKLIAEYKNCFLYNNTINDRGHSTTSSLSDSAFNSTLSTPNVNAICFKKKCISLARFSILHIILFFRVSRAAYATARFVCFFNLCDRHCHFLAIIIFTWFLYRLVTLFFSSYFE